MKPYVEKRMLNEYNDLELKIKKLREFMRGDVFRCLTPDEQRFMKDQLFYMQGYLIALGNTLHSRNIL